MQQLHPLRSLTLLIVLFGVSVTGGDDRSRQRSPGGERRFVLSLSFFDGPGTSSARETTVMGVTAAGGVFASPDGAAAPVEVDRMRPEQLAGLIQEVEQSGRLREIDSATLEQDLRRACRSSGFAFEIEGATVTVIRCRTSEGPVEVRCPALSIMAARFPDFPAVRQLLTTQLRLQNVAAVASAGGEQASAQLAAIANRTLQESQPDVPPLTPRDLSMVRTLSTGSRYVQFYRAPTGQREELLVSIFQTPGQPPRVSVLASPGAEAR